MGRKTHHDGRPKEPRMAAESKRTDLDELLAENKRRKKYLTLTFNGDDVNITGNSVEAKYGGR